MTVDFMAGYMAGVLVGLWLPYVNRFWRRQKAKAA